MPPRTLTPVAQPDAKLALPLFVVSDLGFRCCLGGTGGPNMQLSDAAGRSPGVRYHGRVGYH